MEEEDRTRANIYDGGFRRDGEDEKEAQEGTREERQVLEEDRK